MINNFKQVRQYLNFEDKNDFYIVEVIKRKKDNSHDSTFKKHEKHIQRYYINSLEDFDKKQHLIVDCCLRNDVARSYIKLNKRNHKHLAKVMAVKINEILLNDNENEYKRLESLYTKVSGKHFFEKREDKKFIIDLDEENLSLKEEILEYLKTHDDFQFSKFKEDLVIDIFPSKTGLHILTKTFNINKFNKKFPQIDVHPDNMILLFINKN
jgi:hypothetical protein